MSKVFNIKKALRVEALLRDAFTDTPGVRLSVHAIEDHSIGLHAVYHGTDEYEVTSGHEAFTATIPSDGVRVSHLWKQALHPLDHWVDVQVQIEQAATAGQL